ncbi:MAG: malonate transporter [Paracoccaceae bacterium]
MIGYFIVYKGWFLAADMRVMGKYVMNIAMPALLFNAVASRDVGDVFHSHYMLVYLLGGLAIIAISWLWFSWIGIDNARRAIAVMGSTCANSGFVGYPVMLLTFPDIAGLILALNMLVENIILIPICLILMDMTKEGETLSIRRTIVKTFWGVIRRPMVIGLLLGLAASLLSLPVPDAMSRLFTMLAASAAALSLVVVGGSLVGLKLIGNRARALQVAFGKLFVHPAMMILAAISVPLLGFEMLSPDMYAAAILSAAMPMFGIYTVLAQELGLEGPASIAMLAATSLSFVTLTGFLFWLT